MDFAILGPIEVTQGKRRIPVRPPMERKLLALLVLLANRVVSRDEIADVLWDADQSAHSANAVHYHVRALRKCLGERGRDAIATEPPGYVLQAPRRNVDHLLAHDLHQAGRSAMRTDPVRAAELLRRALSLWRGRPLADFEYELFARPAVIAFDELKLVLLEDLFSVDVATGDLGDVIPQMAALVSEHPMRERLVGLFMVALYRTGRQGEALRTMGEMRRTLREQLGIDPSAELSALEEQILRGDPALGATMAWFSGGPCD